MFSKFGVKRDDHCAGLSGIQLSLDIQEALVLAPTDAKMHGCSVPCIKWHGVCV